MNKKTSKRYRKLIESSKDKKQYTGTTIIGIATMHKSNLVPVTNKKAAEDISKMRRG